MTVSPQPASTTGGAATQGAHHAPQPTRPLTDPADLFALLGRFMACFLLSVLTVVYIFRHIFPFALVFGVLSFFVQRAAIKLWRRLRDERAAAEAALLPSHEHGGGEAAP